MIDFGIFCYNIIIDQYILSKIKQKPMFILSLQVNPQNKSQFETISPERAFADFIFAHIILHLVVINFIGWTVHLYGREITKNICLLYYVWMENKSETQKLQSTSLNRVDCI